MTLEELYKESKEHEESEAKEDKEEDSDANKAYDSALLETLTSLTEHVKSLTESQDAVFERIESLEKANHLGEAEDKTHLEAQPATSDSEDIGADIKAPDTYQSNSRQAGLDDDKSGDDKPEGDEKNLEMQDKANQAPQEHQQIQKQNFDFTTETPRPNAAIDTIEKSNGDVELNMVLKDARSEGYDGLNKVAQKILGGEYGTPSKEEAWF